MTVLSSFIQRQPNGRFVGSGTASQERDTGDCSCTLKWTQRKLPAGSPASSPAQGWPLLEAQGTPGRCTAAPPLSRRRSLTPWPTAGPSSTPGGYTCRAGDQDHLVQLPPHRPPISFLLHGTRVGTKPSPVIRSKGPMEQGSHRENTGPWWSATESQAEEKLSRW